MNFSTMECACFGWIDNIWDKIRASLLFFLRELPVRNLSLFLTADCWAIFYMISFSLASLFSSALGALNFVLLLIIEPPCNLSTLYCLVFDLTSSFCACCSKPYVSFQVHVPPVCMLDGVHSQHFFGTGVVIHHSDCLGLVAVDRNTVAVSISDIMLSFAAYPIEIPGEVLVCCVLNYN